MNSRRRILPAIECVAAAVALLAGISACSRSPADSAENSLALLLPSPEPPPRPAPPARLDPEELPELLPDLPGPGDAAVQAAASPIGHPESARAFEALSWRAFVAMNWPALPDGRPDRAQVPGQHGDNPTAWNAWKEAAQIFPARIAIPAALRELPPGTRVLTRIAQVPGLLADFNQPFDTAPLIDQNGRYARFEILVNRPLLDHLADHAPAPGAPPATAETALLRALDPAAEAEPDAMLIKAAWKVLSPAEIAVGRFHATRAVIYTPASVEPPLPERVEHATVGLVGLHIVHRDASAPRWVWSAFEHVDNCPTHGEPADRAAYNFYNKAAPELPANIPPAPPWDPTVVEPPSRRPQLVRQTPLEAPARELNAAYQAALRAVNPASVWQYYQLVGAAPLEPGASPGASPPGLACLSRVLR